MNTGQKIKIYSVSFFLAPLGLYWFIKYFRNEDPAIKREGYKALLITVVAFVLSLLVIRKYLAASKDYIELYESNIDVYRQMGY